MGDPVGRDGPHRRVGGQAGSFNFGEASGETGEGDPVAVGDGGGGGRRPAQHPLLAFGDEALVAAGALGVDSQGGDTLAVGGQGRDGQLHDETRPGPRNGSRGEGRKHRTAASTPTAAAHTTFNCRIHISSRGPEL